MNDRKDEPLNKDALIERFWDLIECSEEGYASALRLLRQASRPEDLDPIEHELESLPEDREGLVERITLLLSTIRGEELQTLVQQMDQIGANCEECGAPCDRDATLCDKCETKVDALPRKTAKPRGFFARLFGRP